MTFDFDTPVLRSPNYSYKWNKYKGRDVIPCWVADSEFRSPPAVISALQDLVSHGVMGYLKPDDYAEGRAAIVDWLLFRHGVEVDPDWVVWMPGVVPGFNTACRAFTEKGDSLLVQTPNYPPILQAHKNHGLNAYKVPVVEINGRDTLDFDAIESHAKDPRCRMMILCNPMNPNGSMLERAELERLGHICEQNNVILCSDEIHCDLVLEAGKNHIPAYGVDSLMNRSVTLMSAAKTFNIAGLGVSFGIIPDPTLRRRFLAAAGGLQPWANITGLVATTSALRDSRDWYKASINYLRGNRDYLYDALNKLPGMSVKKADATFLAWVDASGLGVEDIPAWFEARGVGPSTGGDFGEPNFVRINFACSRITLEQIVERISR